MLIVRTKKIKIYFFGKLNIKDCYKNFRNKFIKSSTTTIHKVQVQKNSTVQRRLIFFNFKKY